MVSAAISLSFPPHFAAICGRSSRALRPRPHRLQLIHQGRRFSIGKCRAELSADAPVAFAIGACILNSLIFPDAPSTEDSDTESVIDSGDARFAVMGVICFIPYFNWLSWVFAWLDTGKVRYAVYAVVYLAPYLRSNLSLSPEESWLPLLSIILCILHIQLEASIRDGDIQGFQALNQVAKLVSLMTKRSRTARKREDFHKIPSPEEHFKKEVKDVVSPTEADEENEDASIKDDSDR